MNSRFNWSEYLNKISIFSVGIKGLNCLCFNISRDFFDQVFWYFIFTSDVTASFVCSGEHDVITCQMKLLADFMQIFNVKGEAWKCYKYVLILVCLDQVET